MSESMSVTVARVLLSMDAANCNLRAMAIRENLGPTCAPDSTICVSRTRHVTQSVGRRSQIDEPHALGSGS